MQNSVVLGLSDKETMHLKDASKAREVEMGLSIAQFPDHFNEGRYKGRALRLKKRCC